MSWAMARGVGCCLLLVATVAAQGNLPRPSQRTLERELAERREAALRAGLDRERLLDLLVRRHLGISIEDAEYVSLAEGERVRAPADLEQEVTAQLLAVAKATRELEQRQRQLDERRRVAALRAVDSPPGATTPRAPDLTAAAPPPPLVEEPAAAPAHPTAPEKEPVVEAAQPTLVKGVLDPSQLGRALFRAGSYERAKQALEQVAEAKDAPLNDLFLLAKTYEKLGQLDRADGVYLRIEARDADGGRWVAAARTARQHMTWMRDHGAWQPPALPMPSTSSGDAQAMEAKPK